VKLNPAGSLGRGGVHLAKASLVQSQMAWNMSCLHVADNLSLHFLVFLHTFFCNSTVSEPFSAHWGHWTSLEKILVSGMFNSVSPTPNFPAMHCRLVSVAFSRQSVNVLLRPGVGAGVQVFRQVLIFSNSS